jgi:hypothetical protein
MSNALEYAVHGLAEAGWRCFQAINRRIPESASPQPEWAPGPLPKSHERSRPPLGWPGETDSLCPTCIIETRGAILRGERRHVVPGSIDLRFRRTEMCVIPTRRRREPGARRSLPVVGAAPPVPPGAHLTEVR